MDLKIKFCLNNSSLTLGTSNLRKLLGFFLFLLLDSFVKILLSDIGVVCLRILYRSRTHGRYIGDEWLRYHGD